MTAVCGFVQSQPHLVCVLSPDHGSRHSLYPIEALCECGHPVGWHRKNIGSCIECACLSYESRLTGVGYVR